MGVPQVYRKSRGEAIKSFSFNDIIDGAGIRTFFGFSSVTSGTTYHLGSSDALSRIIEHTYGIVENAGDVNSGTFQRIDLDFDLPAFNKSTRLRGDASVIITHFAFTGSSASLTSWFVFKVRKWDGSTETEIASGETDHLAIGSGNTEKIVKTTFIKIPRTQFKKGEVLRLTVQGFVTPTNNSGSNFAFGHDPENRDGTLIVPSTDDPRTITKLLFKVPFDINV